MTTTTRALLLGLLLLATASAGCQKIDPTGEYQLDTKDMIEKLKGKMASMPKNEQRGLKFFLALFRGTKMTLKLNKDSSVNYTSTVVFAGKTRSRTERGSWKQTGNTLSFTTSVEKRVGTKAIKQSQTINCKIQRELLLCLSRKKQKGRPSVEMRFTKLPAI